MAYTGGSELILARPNCNPIKLEVEAQSSTLSMQRSHIKSAKSEVSRFNHGVKAPGRRVYLFQIIAIFGIILCENPPLVDGLDGLARADEKRNYLLIGFGEGSSDDVVLQGSPYTARLGRPSVSARVSSLQLSSKEDELEEILSVKLKLLRGKASAFRVFINLPDANEQTSITCPEFSGAYFHEPRRVKSPDFEYQVTIFRIGISDIIKDLGLMEHPSILVTFVPCGADKGLPIVLESVQIELD